MGRKDMAIALWDKFDEIMSERGFKLIVHNNASQGRGSVAFKDDKFAPVFGFHVWGGPIKEDIISLHVEDRNGNFSLDGPTAAIYSLNNTGDFDKNLKLLTMMVDDCLEAFGSYSKESRLDFVFNELTIDRKTYDESSLVRESGLNDIVNFLENLKGKKIYAAEDLFEFSSGNKVSTRETYIGTVKGFGNNKDCLASFHRENPCDVVYVYMHNENNPKSYQDFAIKTEDFLGWVKEGKYKVPIKEVLPDLEGLIEAAQSATNSQQLVKEVKRNFEQR